MISLSAAVLGHYGKEAYYDVPDELEGHLHDLLYALNEENGVYGSPYSSDLFTVRMYDWNLELGEDALPNFECGKYNYKLWWYKYAGRSQLANRPITYDEFVAMIEECMDELEHPDGD